MKFSVVPESSERCTGVMARSGSVASGFWSAIALSFSLRVQFLLSAGKLTWTKSPTLSEAALVRAMAMAAVRRSSGTARLTAPTVAQFTPVETRDLGGLVTKDGHRIREGVVVRSDNPRGLTETGQVELMQQIGPRTVLDLRMEIESTHDGYVLKDSTVTVKNLPMTPLSGVNQEQIDAGLITPEQAAGRRSRTSSPVRSASRTGSSGAVVSSSRSGRAPRASA